MIWRVLGDVATVVVIVIITVLVAIVGIGLHAIHKHMMKD